MIFLGVLFVVFWVVMLLITVFLEEFYGDD